MNRCIPAKGDADVTHDLAHDVTACEASGRQGIAVCRPQRWHVCCSEGAAGEGDHRRGDSETPSALARTFVPRRLIRCVASLKEDVYRCACESTCQFWFFAPSP